MSRATHDYYPKTIVANDTIGNFWSQDSMSDIYTYHYNCGHTYNVGAFQMAQGGQVAPPACPVCHPNSRQNDMMEANIWAQNPKWTVFTGVTQTDPGHTHAIPKATTNLAWLTLQISKVRQQAWR